MSAQRETCALIQQRIDSWNATLKEDSETVFVRKFLFCIAEVDRQNPKIIKSWHDSLEKAEQYFESKITSLAMIDIPIKEKDKPRINEPKPASIPDPNVNLKTSWGLGTPTTSKPNPKPTSTAATSKKPVLKKPINKENPTNTRHKPSLAITMPDTMTKKQVSKRNVSSARNGRAPLAAMLTPTLDQHLPTHGHKRKATSPSSLSDGPPDPKKGKGKGRGRPPMSSSEKKKRNQEIKEKKRKKKEEEVEAERQRKEKEEKTQQDLIESARLIMYLRSELDKKDVDKAKDTDVANEASQV